ncbi:hypothetical protein M2347_001439 [Chryseobacterium sp. H1D6B]|uniref:hypothetical protein n=1 Tax=Chryseobacterium sp. H1D6B TaxID=2940588 RepID=UPI0017906227|nr:hypothetical protein [Chryseobacterium sp. H1D6B]MDH6251712.1 hypothetical protein [Chryseobacterium sp. H1D6B]
MKKIILMSAFMLSSFAVHAQNINNNELPEYIVVTAEETKLLGGIGLSISSKNSPYKDNLDKLEDVITSKKGGEGVRNLTDLFNTMYKYGFEYVNAFQSTAFGVGGGDGIGAGSSKSRSNIVFKKTAAQK